DDTCSGGRDPACRDIVVLTERGPVRGTVGDGLAVFLGVPYAAPPVGGLRWRPPIQHSPWFRPVDAKSFGSPCPLVEEFWSLPSLNEDCLFLNVFAPHDEAEDRDGGRGHRHPVMVWIHGGGLFSGESNDYRPTRLVKQGDIIVVTINYRLGALGFLAHPALTAESGTQSSGNYGLPGQQFALRWVQRS